MMAPNKSINLTLFYSIFLKINILRAKRNPAIIGLYRVNYDVQYILNKYCKPEKYILKKLSYLAVNHLLYSFS